MFPMHGKVAPKYVFTVEYSLVNSLPRRCTSAECSRCCRRLRLSIFVPGRHQMFPCNLHAPEWYNSVTHSKTAVLTTRHSGIAVIGVSCRCHSLNESFPRGLLHCLRALRDRLRCGGSVDLSLARTGIPLQFPMPQDSLQ